MASAADKGHVLARNGEKTEEGKLDEILLRGLQSSSDEQAGTGSASASASASGVEWSGVVWSGVVRGAR